MALERAEPVVAPQPPAELQAYRPLSGLAIAGLALACVFTGLVGIGAVVALAQGAPFLLPVWALGMAVVAAVLCFLAQRQIRNSEGTQAGLALARWGFWLSVFAGTGFFAYRSFTELALKQQADAFLRQLGADAGFFPLLQQGKDKPEQIDQAFLLTQAPGDRTTRPEDLARIFNRPGPKGPVGMLTMFRDHFLVRAIVRNGDKAKFEALELQDWAYERNSYKMLRRYKITTAEAVFDVQLGVASSEGEAGSTRKWMVIFPPQGLTVTLTPLGQALEKAGASAHQFFSDRLESRKAGKALADFADQTAWEKVAKGLPVEEVRDRILSMLKKEAPDPNFLKADLAKQEHLEIWEISNSRLRFHFSFFLTFKGPIGIPFTAEGTAVVESLGKRIESEADLLDPGFGAGANWRIVSLKFHRLSNPMSKG